jgi:hypothetical protein
LELPFLIMLAEYAQHCRVELEKQKTTLKSLLKGFLFTSEPS